MEFLDHIVVLFLIFWGTSILFPIVIVIQSLSHVWLFATPWLLCPSLSPRVFSNSFPLSWWCYLAISSPAAPFFCLQCFPASGSPVNQLLASGGQSIGASAFFPIVGAPTYIPTNNAWGFPFLHILANINKCYYFQSFW